MTQATPFFVVYDVEGVVPIKVMVPSAWLALASKLTNPHGRIYDVEALEERRKDTKDRWMSYLKASRAYN